MRIQRFLICQEISENICALEAGLRKKAESSTAEISLFAGHMVSEKFGECVAGLDHRIEKFSEMVERDV